MNLYLRHAHATGAVFAHSVVAAPWGLTLGGSIQLSLHTVTQGRAWMWLDHDADGWELLPGTVALVRGGREHHIAHEHGAPCAEHEEFTARTSATGLSARDPSVTVFLCGAYQLSDDIGASLLDALPPVVVLPSAADEPIRDAVRLISNELTNEGPGSQTVLDRLLDVLLVLALRTDFQRNSSAPRWFRASTDPRLQAALQAIHESPEHPWSVPELAARSGLSASAFARAFQSGLGQTPLQYLTGWRMAIARDLLRADRLSLTGVATAIGYGSPYAFSAAFRRHHGVPPGAWRDAATNGPAGG